MAKVRASDGAVAGAIWGVFLACAVAVWLCCGTLTPPDRARNEQQTSEQIQTDSASNNRPTQGGIPAFDNANPYIADGPEARERRKEEREITHLGLTVGNIALSLLVSGLTLWVLTLQWRTMRQQGRYLRAEMKATEKAAVAAKDTVEQMRKQQRAWLSITIEGFKQVPRKPIEIDLNISNSGAHPASITSTKISCGWPNEHFFDLDKLVADHRNRDWEKRANTIAPNATYEMAINDLPEMDQATLSHVGFGTVVFYAIVSVRYSDFAAGRETQVFLVYDYVSKTFRQHERGNYLR